MEVCMNIYQRDSSFRGQTPIIIVVPKNLEKYLTKTPSLSRGYSGNIDIDINDLGIKFLRPTDSADKLRKYFDAERAMVVTRKMTYLDLSEKGESPMKMQEKEQPSVTKTRMPVSLKNQFENYAREHNIALEDINLVDKAHPEASVSFNEVEGLDHKEYEELAKEVNELFVGAQPKHEKKEHKEDKKLKTAEAPASYKPQEPKQMKRPQKEDARRFFERETMKSSHKHAAQERKREKEKEHKEKILEREIRTAEIKRTELKREEMKREEM
jgi:hypothetical protein